MQWQNLVNVRFPSLASAFYSRLTPLTPFLGATDSTWQIPRTLTCHVRTFLPIQPGAPVAHQLAMIREHDWRLIKKCHNQALQGNHHCRATVPCSARGEKSVVCQLLSLHRNLIKIHAWHHTSLMYKPMNY